MNLIDVGGQFLSLHLTGQMMLCRVVARASSCGSGVVSLVGSNGAAKASQCASDVRHGVLPKPEYGVANTASVSQRSTLPPPIYRVDNRQRLLQFACAHSQGAPSVVWLLQGV